MANQWLRLWHDMPTDPKWRSVARVSKQRIGDVMAVYVHLLVCGSNATERGRTQSFCSEDVANALDIETEQVDAILAAMQGRVLDGDVLRGWAKRQVEREDGAAERAKAWREARKAEKSAESNASERNRTQPERKQTPDKDTEEIREEKETSPAARGVEPQSFQDFWSTWPKSGRKGGKAECLKVWQAGKLEAQAPAILAHVKTMAASRQWTKDEGEFIPAPVVYLRKKHWDGAEVEASGSLGAFEGAL
jgi:hypothetical protein